MFKKKESTEWLCKDNTRPFLLDNTVMVLDKDRDSLLSMCVNEKERGRGGGGGGGEKWVGGGRDWKIVKERLLDRKIDRPAAVGR